MDKRRWLAAIEGDYENPLMFLPLPLLCLAALLGQEVWAWWSNRQPVGLPRPDGAC